MTALAPKRPHCSSPDCQVGLGRTNSRRWAGPPPHDAAGRHDVRHLQCRATRLPATYSPLMYGSHPTSHWSPSLCPGQASRLLLVAQTLSRDSAPSGVVTAYSNVYS